jgi:hypothetical protein
MVTSISSRRNAARPAFIAMLSLALVVAFTSCAQANQSSAPQSTGTSVVGSWKSQFDGYTITASTITYDDGGFGCGYEGSSLVVSATNEASGYIYCKYKTVGMYLDAKDVGKYYAVAYKTMPNGSLGFSNAYKKGGLSAADTLDAAKNEFTLANGYFAIYSNCVKQ